MTDNPPQTETQAQLLTHELATLQKEATLREEQQHTIQERITAITQHTSPNGSLYPAESNPRATDTQERT